MKVISLFNMQFIFITVFSQMKLQIYFNLMWDIQFPNMFSIFVYSFSYFSLIFDIFHEKHALLHQLITIFYLNDHWPFVKQLFLRQFSKKDTLKIRKNRILNSTIVSLKYDEEPLSMEKKF
jgi:hypothetical protein